MSDVNREANREAMMRDPAVVLVGRDAAWTAATVEALLPSLRVRQRRRRTLRVAGGAAMMAVVGLAALRLSGLQGEGSRVAGGAERKPGEALAYQFVDGSRAMPLSLSTRWQIRQDNAHRAEVSLEEGGARFSVTKGRARAFTVRSGDVRVTVHGTVFTIARNGARTYVAVHEGRVTVAWPGGERAIGAGDRGHFPPAASGGESTFDLP